MLVNNDLISDWGNSNNHDGTYCFIEMPKNISDEKIENVANG